MPPKYRPDIDGLRGISVIAVVLYHARVPGFDGGYVGVDVFFVISGYLITSILLQRDGKEFGIVSFYERRIRRLFPALFCVLLFSRDCLSLSFAAQSIGSLWPGTDFHDAFCSKYFLLATVRLLRPDLRKCISTAFVVAGSRRTILSSISRNTLDHHTIRGEVCDFDHRHISVLLFSNKRLGCRVSSECRLLPRPDPEHGSCYWVPYFP